MANWNLPSPQDNFQQQFKHGTYQQDVRAEIIHTLRTLGCGFRHCIDGGAHIGTWSIDLVTHFEWVHAFEPVPAVADCFTRNIQAANLTFHNKALGAEPGKVMFDYDATKSGATQAKQDGNIECEVITIDSLALKDLDYIKLDCQGMEPQILAGAVDTIKSQRPILHLEMKNSALVEYRTNKSEFRQLIAGHGYRQVKKIVNEEIFIYDD